MGDAPEIPAEWTKPERWVWAQIAAGEPADLNTRGHDQVVLDPQLKKGWTDDRRLSSKFLQTILLQKAFVEATPYSGVRISGALIDDAALDLEHARLPHQLWLNSSRILVDIECHNLSVDGGISLQKSFVAGATDLSQSSIREFANLSGSTFEGKVSLSRATVGGSAFLHYGATFKQGLSLVSARIGTDLDVDGSTFEGGVINLSGATVGGAAFFSERAIFKSQLKLRSAVIGRALFMDGSTFEEEVSLNRAKVNGPAFLRYGANFKGRLSLMSAEIGSDLDMDGSTFEGLVDLSGATVNGAAFFSKRATFRDALNLVSARIGSDLDMNGSTFEGDVSLYGATVDGWASLSDKAIFGGGLNLGSAKISSHLKMRGSTFAGDVNLDGAEIGSSLNILASTFEGDVDLTGCTITGDFLLGLSSQSKACWGNSASLTLRNTHVGALQGWWRNESENAWPGTYELEGFRYDRLGSRRAEKEGDMLARPVSSFRAWLQRDTSSSPQPYEQLAQRFYEAGEPYKATDILYASRKRQRCKAWSTVIDHSHVDGREWLRALARALGLWTLEVTIGYGLGNRYFRVLFWVAGLTLLGTFVLIFFGSHSLAQWPRIFFASLDQLLPIFTLDNAHDALVFGDPSAKPPVDAQRYGLLVYFYAHKTAGWILGSFLVAGLAGLTQRN